MDPLENEVGQCACGHVFTAKDIVTQESRSLNCPNCGRDNLVCVHTQPTEEEYYASIAENIKESLNFPPEDDLPF